MKPWLRDERSGLEVALDLHQTVASTQELALETLRAASSAEMPRAWVVWAHRQERGRGREGRGWREPPQGEGLYATLAWREPDLRVDMSEVASSALAAAAQAVSASAACGKSPEQRAPNDLYVADAKLGGLLVDAQTQGDVLRWLAIGFGLNLTGAPFDADGRSATSVQAAWGAKPAAELVLREWVSRTLALLAQPKHGAVSGKVRHHDKARLQ